MISEITVSGVSDTAERLFGVKVTRADNDAPRWRDDLIFFRITDRDDTLLGGIYLDPYHRQNKDPGAWMVPLTHREVSNERTHEPIAFMSCSQPPPSQEGAHAPMSFHHVVSLFHEFGHALQHVMAKGETLEASGISSIEQDAVEIASQFMEAWCFDAQTIKTFAKHRETGADLEDDFVERVVKTRNAYLRQKVHGQLSSSWTDLHMHGEGFSDFKRAWRSADILRVKIDGEEKNASPQALLRPGQAYRYLWSQMFVEDALSLFRGQQGGEEGERALGLKFANTVMKQGGSDDPAESFKAFRGRHVSRVPFIDQVSHRDKKERRPIWKDFKTVLSQAFKIGPHDTAREAQS